ncbi:MAG: putative DNA binding domain-containing protein [Prevotella sp.]|nr:putative DNA binding domain-containing protein [Prevotella sp.]
MTIEEIKSLIRNDETRTLELKKTTGELKDGMQSACAFLNTSGGWLVFGITPTTLEIVGQQVTDNTRREIAHELTKIEPAISVEVEYVRVENTPDFYVIALHLDTAIHRDVPYVYDARPYYRVESTTKIMSQPMYQELLRKKDARRQLWEEEKATNLSVENLEEDAIRRVVRAGVEAGRVPERMLHKEIREILEMMHLSDGGVLKNAAAALFVKEEFAPIQFHLRMARFKGVTKREFIDNRRVSGNIFRLYDEGMAFFFKHLNVSGTFVDGQGERVESLTIPYKALRECLLNALAHRIYRNADSFVSIAIYDDRIEVENSGILPDGFSLDDLMKPHSSHAQNPLIAQVMYFGKYLETWGRGIELMQEQCEEAHVDAPLFKAEAGCFRVVFLRPDDTQVIPEGVQQGGTTRGTTGGTTGGQSSPTLPDVETKILELITITPNISISAIAQKIKMTRKNAYRHISSMQERGLIKREGPNFGGTWKVLYKKNPSDGSSAR